MAPRIKQEQRIEIVKLRKKGLRVVDISRQTGIGRKTIYLWLRRIETDGDVKVHHRQFYQRATDPAQDIAIVSEHLNNPFKSTKETSMQFNVSKDTVRRRIKEAGLKFRKTGYKKKSLLEGVDGEIVNKNYVEEINGLEEGYSINNIDLCKIELKELDQSEREDNSIEHCHQNISTNHVLLPQIKTKIVGDRIHDNSTKDFMENSQQNKNKNYVFLPQIKTEIIDESNNDKSISDNFLQNSTTKNALSQNYTTDNVFSSAIKTENFDSNHYNSTCDSIENVQQNNNSLFLPQIKTEITDEININSSTDNLLEEYTANYI